MSAARTMGRTGPPGNGARVDAASRWLYCARPMSGQPLPPIRPEAPGERAEVEALIDAAFGPGRYAKSAERLREGNHPLLNLSMVAVEGGAVVGCSRMWPIRIGKAPALLLGPFAVRDDQRSRGLGAALVERCCEAAAAAGHALVLLVGDAAYFSRLDFQPAPDVKLPGPVDQRRVLVRALKPGAANSVDGPVTHF